MIKLVIFDMDGVLTSTTHEHFGAWASLFKQHFNIEIDPDLEVKTKGVSRMDSLKVLLDHYKLNVDEATKTNLAREKNEAYQQLIAQFDESKWLPGVKDCLEYLKAHHIKCALGSASKNGPFLLKAIKLEQYFDYVVDPGPLRSKPHPDIFLDAAIHFGYNPQECIGVEDAEAGIEAIKQAGMFAIGIGPERLEKADLKVKTFPELSKEKWDEILKGKN